MKYYVIDCPFPGSSLAALPVDNWLTTANALAAARTPFVLATIWSKSGNSPDKTGSRMVITADREFGDFVSEHRRQQVSAHAKKLLSSADYAAIKRYPLGKILDTQNGTYEVVFIRFATGESPEWLTTGLQLQKRGKTFVLAQRICCNGKRVASFDFHLICQNHPGRNIADAASHRLLDSTSGANTTELILGQHHQTLLQLITEPVINVCIIGSGRVACCLVEQLMLLPVTVRWFADNSKHQKEITLTREPLLSDLFKSIAPNSRVVIATGDHHSDLHYCALALRSDNVSYIGCIGSEKKARLMKNRLVEMGLEAMDVQRLHIPIGVPEIIGNHPSIVAASIVAQLLTFYECH